MRSLTKSGVRGASLMGLAVGLGAGLAAGLLLAPSRGSEMRAKLRDGAADSSARLQSLASSGREWATHALDRSVSLVEAGRRALGTGSRPPEPLHATVAEIASTHTSASQEVLR